MNAFTTSLAVLVAASVLWIAAAGRVEAPRPILKPIPQKAVLQVDCTERQRICAARQRMEKVRAFK